MQTLYYHHSSTEIAWGGPLRTEGLLKAQLETDLIRNVQCPNKYKSNLLENTFRFEKRPCVSKSDISYFTIPEQGPSQWLRSWFKTWALNSMKEIPSLSGHAWTHVSYVYYEPGTWNVSCEIQLPPLFFSGEINWQQHKRKGIPTFCLFKVIDSKINTKTPNRLGFFFVCVCVCTTKDLHFIWYRHMHAFEEPKAASWLVNMDVMENPPPVPKRRQKYWHLASLHMIVCVAMASEGSSGPGVGGFAKMHSCPLPDV